MTTVVCMSASTTTTTTISPPTPASIRARNTSTSINNRNSDRFHIVFCSDPSKLHCPCHMNICCDRQSNTLGHRMELLLNLSESTVTCLPNNLKQMRRLPQALTKRTDKSMTFLRQVGICQVNGLHLNRLSTSFGEPFL